MKAKITTMREQPLKDPMTWYDDLSRRLEKQREQGLKLVVEYIELYERLLPFLEEHPEVDCEVHFTGLMLKVQYEGPSKEVYFLFDDLMDFLQHDPEKVKERFTGMFTEFIFSFEKHHVDFTAYYEKLCEPIYEEKTTREIVGWKCSGD